MPAWTTKGVHVVLPLDLIHDLFFRADPWDRERGLRFERRYDRGGAVLVIRPAILTPSGRPSAACVAADFHWRTPLDEDATLWRIGWDPHEGGSEELVWEALEAIAGQPIRPDGP